MSADRRGHIWTSRAFPASAQEPAILAAGVAARALYENQIDDVILSLRTGNKLVVHGFRGCGRSRAEIDTNIAKVHAKGAVVMDALTGKLSTGRHRKALVDAAVKALGDERRGPRKRTRKRDKRMPWDQAAKFYFDPRLRNSEVEDAVAANGYEPMTYHTMRRHFRKPRGAPVGRPSANRI